MKGRRTGGAIGTGRRRRAAGIVGAGAALAAVLLPVALAGAAGTAQATGVRLTVTPVIDHGYVPAAPVPVRVEVRSERLVRGRLVASVHVGGRKSSPGQDEQRVELPGGSSKSYLMFPSGPVSQRTSTVRVRFVADDGSQVDERAAVEADREREVVGVLPGLLDRGEVPSPLELTSIGSKHRAEFVKIGTAGWTQPLLGPLNTVVGTADDYAGLDATWADALAAWTSSGGQVVIDAAPGARLGELPAEWFTGQADLPWDRGHVAFSGGAAARGDWATAVRPNAYVALDDGLVVQPSSPFPVVGMQPSVDLDQQLGALATFSSVSASTLVAVAAAYVVLVGPLTFLALARGRRSVAVWVAVPVLAGLATGGVFLARSRFKAEPRFGHLTVLRLGSGGLATATSFVGVAPDWSIGRTARFPAGWSGAPASGIDSLRGGSAGPVAVTVRRSASRTEVRAELGDSRFGIMGGRGAVGHEGRIEIAVTSGEGRIVTGTVTNRSGFDLDRVLLFSSIATISLGDLDRGESTEFTVDPSFVNGHQDDQGNWVPPEIALAKWDPTFQSQLGGIEFGPDGQPLTTVPPPRTSGALTPYALADIDRMANARTTSRADLLVAGWTSGYTPPVSVGGTTPGRGRTLVVDSTMQLGSRLASRMLRGTGGVIDPQPNPGAVKEITPQEWIDTSPLMVFHVGTTSDPLTLEFVGQAANPPRAWNGRDWVELPMREVRQMEIPNWTGGGPIPLGFDGKPVPAPTEPLLRAEVPTEAVVGGRVHVRNNFFGPSPEGLRLVRGAL